MRRAFYEAMEGVPGPVFVEVPIDCLYCVGEVRAGMGLGTVKPAKSIEDADYKSVLIPVEYRAKHKGTDENNSRKYVEYARKKNESYPIFMSEHKKLHWIVGTYLKYQIRNVFAGAFDHQWNTSPLPIDPMTPDEMCVSSTLRLLMSSTKPVLIVSSQALLRAQDKEKYV